MSLDLFLILEIIQLKALTVMATDPAAVSPKPSPTAASSIVPAPAPPSRLESTTASLPIVTGTVAFYLGKKADEFNTHQWTLYLRGPNNEDLSAVISKVVFQLHASFAQPVRELTEGPYEVTERGWGEFEAQIRIVWKDSSEQATVVRDRLTTYYVTSTTQNCLSFIHFY